jgi:hypothetical protein
MTILYTLSFHSLYAFFAVVFILFVMKSVHETKGMELEQMQG